MNNHHQPIVQQNGKLLSVSFDIILNHSSNTAASIDTVTSNTTNHTCTNINTTTTTTSSIPRRTFHAAWLWHNDCRNLIIPSGQKKNSASDWWNKRPLIVKASVHHHRSLAHLNVSNQNVTPKGSIHPMVLLRSKHSNSTTKHDSGKRLPVCKNHHDDCNPLVSKQEDDDYDENENGVVAVDDDDINHDDDDDENVLSNYVLVITWSHGVQEETPSQSQSHASNGTEMEMSYTSIFNMQWLKDWSNHHHHHHHRDGHCDSKGVQDDIILYGDFPMQREVCTKHTFFHAYQRALDTGDSFEIDCRSFHDGLYCVEYSNVVNSSVNSAGILQLLDALFLEGAAIVQNAPNVLSSSSTTTHKHDEACVSFPEQVVTNLGKIISGGSLSHGSLYGDTFHVQSTTDAINVAYTSQALCPHQDLAYYESKPGFQLLHCASMPSNIRGGESILIDCMAAAHKFREMAPDLFAVLVRCSASFVKDRDGARMTYSRPHIVLHADGSEGNDIHREIVGVHWAPPFEGPMVIRPEFVEEYFRAYAAFELMLDDTKCPVACSEATGIGLDLALQLAQYGKQYTWQKLLRPGDVLIFNNTRMLHGRREFHMPLEEIEGSGSGSERHLIGAYTNIDDSLNRYRTLLKESNIVDRIIPNVGNGTISVLP